MIAKIEQLKRLKALLADGILLDVNLKLLPSLLQMGEASLSHEADRHDPPSNAYVDARIFQLLGGLVGVVCQDLRDGMREIVLVAVRGLAESFNLLQLFAAQFVDFLVECQWGPCLSRRENCDYKQSLTLSRLGVGNVRLRSQRWLR